MKSLSKIIEKYAAFEAEVVAYSNEIYFDECSVCKGGCCKREYCAESLSSPFLIRLRERFAPGAVYDFGIGWLTPSGCALPVGRPPVCHQFICDIIQNMRSSADFRYAVTILSNLVAHVGKKARGRKHIVELQDHSELKQINFPRVEKQLHEADAAFRLVRSFLDNDTAKLNPSPILKKISYPPSDYIR